MEVAARHRRQGCGLPALQPGSHGGGIPRGLPGMISIALCGVAFLVCLQMGRRSLIEGLCSLVTIGYAYGIVRANLPDGFSHLIFDSAVMGLYVAQLPMRQPRWQLSRSEDIRTWLIVLLAWPGIL